MVNVMEIIKEITKQIDAELDDAAKYARLANHWKMEQPETAKTFIELANAELDHQSKLHDHVARLIGKYRAERGEPPREMLAVYNYLHDRAMDKAADVMILIKLFNN